MRNTLVLSVLFLSLSACAIQPDSAPQSAKQKSTTSTQKQNFAARGETAAKASNVPDAKLDELLGMFPAPPEKNTSKQIKTSQKPDTKADEDDPFICVGLGCSCSVE